MDIGITSGRFYVRTMERADFRYDAHLRRVVAYEPNSSFAIGLVGSSILA
jgi:hypothetical protein